VLAIEHFLQRRGYSFSCHPLMEQGWNGGVHGHGQARCPQTRSRSHVGDELLFRYFCADGACAFELLGLGLLAS
jgi:hypothetical protein